MNECADSNCTLATPDEEPPGKKEPPSSYLPDSSGYLSLVSCSCGSPACGRWPRNFPWSASRR